MTTYKEVLLNNGDLATFTYEDFQAYFDHLNPKDRTHFATTYGQEILEYCEDGDVLIGLLAEIAKEGEVSIFISEAVRKHGRDWINQWLRYEGLELREMGQ